MTLDFVEALKNGFNRTTKTNGITLALISFVLGISTTSLTQTLMSKLTVLSMASTSTPSSLVLPIPGEIAGLLLGVSAALNTVFGIVTIRTMASEHTERIPREFLTENMFWAWINTIVGGFAFVIAVTLGLVALLVPGIILGVSLYFWSFYVALEDQNFIEGLQSSWKLVKGQRVRVFVLLATVIILSGFFSAVFGLVSLSGYQAVGTLLSTLVGAFTGVFTVASVADAYNQLRSDQEETEQTG